MRVKGNFVICEKDTYSVALARSDDDAIGVLLIVPKVSAGDSNMWRSIREITANVKKEEAKESYKEIWIPGFHIENKDSMVTKGLTGGKICEKSVLKVLN